MNPLIRRLLPTVCSRADTTTPALLSSTVRSLPHYRRYLVRTLQQCSSSHNAAPTRVALHGEIRKLCAAGDVVGAMAVVRRMVAANLQPSAIILSTVLHRSARLGHALVTEQALALSRTAPIASRLPESELLSHLVVAYCRSGERHQHLPLALQTLDSMRRVQLEPSIDAYNAALEAVAAAADYATARELFASLPRSGDARANVTSYSIMLRCALAHGDLDGAQRLLIDMFDANLCPNRDTYDAVLTLFDAVTRRRQLRGASMLLHEFLRHTATSSSDSKPTVLVQRFALACVAVDAYDVLESFSRDVQQRYGTEAAVTIDTWNQIIARMCHKDHYERALRLTLHMEQLGVRANVVTFDTIIQHLLRRGELEHAQHFTKLLLESQERFMQHNEQQRLQRRASSRATTIQHDTLLDDDDDDAAGDDSRYDLSKIR